MSGFENLLLSYLVNSVWQVPLLLVAGFGAARLVRPAGPAAEHRVWVATMLCQALVPAASLMPWEKLHIAWLWRVHAAAFTETGVSLQMGSGTGLGMLSLTRAFMTTIAVVYTAVLVYFGARFAWRCARLAVLTRSSEPLELTHHAARSREQWSGRLGIGPVALFSSAQIFAPITIGYTRKCVLLPSGMLAGLSQRDLDTAIAHEFAHIRRNDFLKNLIYEVLCLPVSYHPALWFARQRMMETREMICDQVAAAAAGNHEYAQSLLRLAAMLLQGKPLRVPHAIGVFDANTLERRLMKLTEAKKQTGRVRRWLAFCTCAVVGFVAATTAIALRCNVDAAILTDSNGTAKSAPRSVPAGEMQAHLLTKVPPTYPVEAKKARIQGKVVLDAVISKTGTVENLKAVSGPKELQQSALDAVRQWTYRPVVLDGMPVEVETTINVVYTLKK